MEEFKIIHLPTKEENNGDIEESSTDLEKLDRKEMYERHKSSYKPPRKRFIIIPILVLIVILCAVIYNIVCLYTDFETVNSWERSDSSNTSYESFNNNLIKYNQDGIFYCSYNGTSIWNYGYDMASPQIKISGNYLIVYDKKGVELDIFNTEGYIKSISTTLPIYDADVADKGTVAIILEENDTSYIQLYDTSATLLASGEIHPENTGYPISMAISSEGTKLALSVLNINDGNIKSNIIIYDFSNNGRKQEDNIVASYSYVDMLVPRIDFVKDDKIIAFGDDEIIIYNNNFSATVEKEIYFTQEIKSLFYNNSYFGYVTDVTTEDGQVKSQLNIYNLYGFQCTKKIIDTSYEEINILSNNELILKNGKDVTLYNIYGFKNFEYTFDNNIYEIIPGATNHRYYIIEENATEEIKLR